MSIEELLKQIQDLPDITDIHVISDIVCRQFYPEDDIPKILKAVLGAYVLQQEYLSAKDVETEIWQVSPASRPKPLKGKHLNEGTVIDSLFRKYAICGNREPVTTDLSELRVFTNVKDAHEWRVRSCLAAEKKGIRNAKEELRLAENDLKSLDALNALPKLKVKTPPARRSAIRFEPSVVVEENVPYTYTYTTNTVTNAEPIITTNHLQIEQRLYDRYIEQLETNVRVALQPDTAAAVDA